MIELVTTLDARYGAYAFGLVTVVVLWWLVIRPELRGFRAAATGLAATAASCGAAAAACERTADKLLQLSARMGKESTT